MVDTRDPTLQPMDATPFATGQKKSQNTQNDKTAKNIGSEQISARGQLPTTDKHKDTPIVPEQGKTDPNRQVYNASNTVRITGGHPCKAGVCSKQGLANCRCKEKDNERAFFTLITYLILQLRALHWQLFHTPPRWVYHPHSHEFRFAEPENQEEVVAECAPIDVVFIDEDYDESFELTDDPFLMILRATVPLQFITREFEVFLKQLAAETPGVQSVQQLYQQGYQLRHDPENGLTLLRMPKPEHQLMFLQHCCRQGLLNMLESEIVLQFALSMQARYGNMLPRLVPRYQAIPRKDNEAELAYERSFRLPLTPLKMNCRLEPVK